MNSHTASPSPATALPEEWRERRRGRRGCGCGCYLWLGAAVLSLGAGLVLLGFVFALHGRINVLVLGLDRRPGEGDAVRADTVMMVTADPRAPHLGLLSIPRDLYLLIPGQGENRINTAHVFGELDRAGGGPERTAAAIVQSFRIRVDGWVRVDFEGFVAVVDALGGIKIDVPETLVDEAYPTEDYGTKVVTIPAGVQRMDGETALQYARSRHSSSDFDRAERQQVVVQAMFRRLAQPAMWPRLPQLYDVFRGSVDTSLSPVQLARLGLAVLRVGPEGPERLVIDQDMVTPTLTPAGAAVLLPRWDLIRPAVERLFDPETVTD
jgi:LCP family protein required for cell wall assembly